MCYSFLFFYFNCGRLYIITFTFLIMYISGLSRTFTLLCSRLRQLFSSYKSETVHYPWLLILPSCSLVLVTTRQLSEHLYFFLDPFLRCFVFIGILGHRIYVGDINRNCLFLESQIILQVVTLISIISKVYFLEFLASSPPE